MKDSIVLLLGEFNPPTNDVREACNLLFKRPEVKKIWMVPLSDGKHARDFATIFCQQYFLETGKQISSCTVGIDNTNLHIGDRSTVEWLRSKYPETEFRIATFGSTEDRLPVYRISFGNITSISGNDIPIRVTNSVCLSNNIRENIMTGKDESRKMYRVLWEHIQKHKIYRG